MDGGPFRGPQSTDRRVSNRSESTHRSSDESQSANEAPKVVYRTAPKNTTEEKKSFKRLIFPIVSGILVILLGTAGWLLWSNSQATNVAIESNKYQAVFFTNGQVYFGKLQSLNGGYMKLTDIYYLQTQAGEQADAKNPQQTSTDQNGVQLIKLGDEIHGPEDAMIISKDQVLFYENLKSDGKVAQSIDKYKQQ